MASIHIKIDRKGVERYSDATFAPGDPMAITIDGRDILRLWADGVEEDPGVTVGQAEVLRDLVEGGVTLEIDEDGGLSVVEV